MRYALLLALIACGDNHGVADAVPPRPDASYPAGPRVLLQRIATTDAQAILVTSPPGDSRLFVIEQSGRIDILQNGTMLPAPFLDISHDQNGPVVCCGEQGLLGLAFHPDYAHNGTFFVFYTTADANVVARYHVSADPNVADPTGSIVLSIPDFASNHNAGMIEFGADGYLYISTGDGGFGGDPNRNGQNTHALLGKMLRLDVDGGVPYAIPPSNPFADGAAGAPEVFMYGLRNPWRWTFDRATGDIWIGDVGQNSLEELDYITAADAPGTNFGWSMYEADTCYNGPCSATSIRMPQFQRDHANDGWCAIIGGQVYRGTRFPELAGTYYFADYCASVLVAARPTSTGLDISMPATSVIEPLTPETDGFPLNPSSFHAGGDGELYMTTVPGGVYHLEYHP